MFSKIRGKITLLNLFFFLSFECGKIVRPSLNTQPCIRRPLCSTLKFENLSVSLFWGKKNWKKIENIKVRNGILLPKVFWPTVRKNCSSDREKLLQFEAEGREFFKNFEITWTIYSNSERSEQFLVTECFFNLFLEVSQI